MSKIVLGFSGGVDSTVSTMLLKKAGHEVYGLYMDNADEAARQCAIDTAEFIGVPLTVLDVKAELERNVCRPFTEAYLRGETPNPCIICNPSTKFKNLLAEADRVGAELVATGHYARTENGRLMKGMPANDQSYMLCRLSREQVRRTVFPLGGFEKKQVRALAEEFGLPVAHKPDSMEICFVPDNDYAGYIERTTDYKSVPGNFVDVDGNVIGKHNGIIHYTVGQRKGLGLAMGHPVFVVAVRPDTNEVVIGENKDVFTDTLYAGNLNFMAIEALKEPMRARGKIRYSHEGADCTIRMIDNNTLECKFDEPQRAVTPGQALVLYDGEYVLGGGTII